MQYKLNYIEKKRTKDTNLALELGSLLHYILEQKGKMIQDGKAVQYDKLQDLLMNGVTDTDDKTQQPLRGILELKKIYSEKWYQPDNASGMNYEQKLSMFDTVLHKEMDNSEWMPLLLEHYFQFVWDNRAIIEGYIDRVDRKGDKYRTVDYKTSKNLIYEKDAAASLQLGIYALAFLNEFGVLPAVSMYRFILLDKEQTALTEGWKKSLIRNLDNLLDSIDFDTKAGVFAPKPIPLCYWCNYCKQNPEATLYKNECDYYSKWTPDNKTSEVNKRWKAL